MRPGGIPKGKEIQHSGGHCTTECLYHSSYLDSGNNNILWVEEVNNLTGILG